MGVTGLVEQRAAGTVGAVQQSPHIRCHQEGQQTGMMELEGCVVQRSTQLASSCKM